MTNAQVYQASPSEKTYIKTEYYPAKDGVATEFQCDNLFEIQQLLCESQKATLAMGYFSIPQVLGITFKAIYQHIKQKHEMIFGQSV